MPGHGRRRHGWHGLHAVAVQCSPSGLGPRPPPGSRDGVVPSQLGKGGPPVVHSNGAGAFDGASCASACGNACTSPYPCSERRDTPTAEFMQRAARHADSRVHSPTESLRPLQRWAISGVQVGEADAADASLNQEHAVAPCARTIVRWLWQRLASSALSFDPAV